MSITTQSTTKNCTRCGEAKSADAFGKQAERLDGLTSWCKVCISVARRARRYNLTFEEARDLLAEWDGLCEICTKPARVPNFDHDHETGGFRGILCHRCNIGIMILDEPILLARAKEYLNR